MEIDFLKNGIENVIDDWKSLEEYGLVPNPNRFIPNSYHAQSPFSENELEGKSRIAIFAGGDDDSKGLSLNMAREAIEKGVQVDFFYRPEWMPDDNGLAIDNENTYHAIVDSKESLSDIVKGFDNSYEKLRKVSNLSDDLTGKTYDDVFVVGTYWNRSIPTIKNLGKVVGYLPGLVDATNGDSLFKHFMERYFIEAVDEARTVDSKNRQIIEERHNNISKEIIYVNELESPLNGLKVLFLPELDLRKDMVPRWRAEWPATHLGDYGVRYRVRGAIEAQLYRPTREELEKDPKRNTIEIVAESEKSLERVKSDIDWADVVIFQRTSNMFSKAVFEYAKNSKKVIGYDVDDLVFGDNAIAPYKNVGLNKLIDEQMKEADFVTVSTETLGHEAAKVRSKRDNIYQIRNRLQLEELALVDKKVKKKPDDGKIRIGWAGGPNHKDKLIETKETVHRLYDKYKDNMTLVIKGFDPNSEDFKQISAAFNEGGRNVQIEGHEYTHVTDWRDYYKDLRALDLDIFFSPAKVDAEHHGKSELKFLEAAYLGVPIVTPKIGEHELVINHGVTGMLADINDINNSMFNCIDELIQSPDLRARIAKNAKSKITKNYDVRKSSEELHNILLDILNK